jgi:hypothetical protein
MANGTGNFTGKKRLAFITNIGTLIQPITKTQFNNWEDGNDFALPVPKALFSHSDQIEQWQTAVPQGLAQLNGWAGRCADVLHTFYNTGATSMNISLGGNNIFQVGNTTQQFVITPSGSLSFEGDTGGANGNPLRLKNSGLISTTRTCSRKVSRRSPSRATGCSFYFRRNLIPPARASVPPWTRCSRPAIISPPRSRPW